jgi:hypothetical protein
VTPMKFILTTLFALALAGPTPAQRPVGADRSSRFDPRSSEGVFDIHVRVDGEAFLYVKGAGISHLIVSGAPLRIERSTYSQPIPDAEFGVFELQKIDGRGKADLFEAPHSSNDYTAIIRVNDDRGGPDLYHLRLHWTWNPDDPSRPPRVGDIRDVGWGGFPRIDFPGFYEPDEGSLEFRGRVDQITAISIRGQRVRSEDFAGRPLRDGRFDLSNPLPSRPMDIELIDVRGRGSVDLVEKPWEGNGYTAVVRIEDERGGAGDYSFDLVWRLR